MKRTINNKRRNKGNGNANKVFEEQLRICRTLLGSPVEKIVQINETLTTTSGSALVNFSTTSAMYYELYKRVQASADYTEMNDAYQRAVFQSVRITLTRRFTENNNTSIISTGIPNLRIAFFPGLSGSALTSGSVLNSESALIVDPHEVRPVSITYPIPSIFSYDSNGAPFNPGVPFDTNNTMTSVTSGVFGVYWSNATTASSTSLIYDIRIQVLMRFDIPY